MITMKIFRIPGSPRKGKKSNNTTLSSLKVA